MDIYSAWEAEREKQSMEYYGLVDDESPEPDDDYEYDKYMDEKLLRGDEE